MKANKSILTIALSSIVVFATLVSCGKPSDKIVGVWKMSDMKIANMPELTADQKASFDAEMKTTKDSSSFEAKSDGTYHNITWAGKKYPSDGKWTFDGTNLILTDGPKLDSVKVTSISDKQMVWDVKGSTITFVK
jgi:hypothetical protein